MLRQKLIINIRLLHLVGFFSLFTLCFHLFLSRDGLSEDIAVESCAVSVVTAHKVVQCLSLQHTVVQCLSLQHTKLCSVCRYSTQSCAVSVVRAHKDRYCIWCPALVLLDVVGSGCGALRCRIQQNQGRTPNAVTRSLFS
jgi:hypothetical protein